MRNKVRIRVGCSWSDDTKEYTDNGPLWVEEPTDWMKERMMVLRAANTGEPNPKHEDWADVVIKGYGELNRYIETGDDYFYFPKVEET